MASADDDAVPAAIGAADLILDGLLGIGGRGGLREPQASLAGLAARSPAVVVAVDLPSGVDADTGVVEGSAIQADVTVTFGTLKPGLLIDPGAGHAGVVELIDIGLGPYLDSPDASALQARGRGCAAAPAAAGTPTSTAGAWPGSWRAASGSPERPRWPWAARSAAGPGWSGWCPRRRRWPWSGCSGRRR